MRLYRAAFAIAATLLGCVPAFALDQVTLRLDWVFGSEHAPIFLAKEKGFFRDEGIDVNILPGEGSTVTVKLVGNRTTEFGYAGADQALMAHGRDLPVVSTAVILQKESFGDHFPEIHWHQDVAGPLWQNARRPAAQQHREAMACGREDPEHRQFQDQGSAG